MATKSFDLSELLNVVSELSYDIEYEENLNFAREFLNLKGAEAKKFASDAASEQRLVDEQAIKAAKVKQILIRLAERRKNALASLSKKKKIQKNKAKIFELYELLGSLKI